MGDVFKVNFKTGDYYKISPGEPLHSSDEFNYVPPEADFREFLESVHIEHAQEVSAAILARSRKVTDRIAQGFELTDEDDDTLNKTQIIMNFFDENGMRLVELMSYDIEPRNDIA